MNATVPARRQSPPPGTAGRSLTGLASRLRRHDVAVDQTAGTATSDATLRLADEDDAYVLTVPATRGLRDLDVQLWGRRLRVTGQRTRRERYGWLRWRRRPVGWLRVDVLLPTAGEAAGSTAELRGDVLTVRVPKRARDRRRQIPVT